MIPDQNLFEMSRFWVSLLGFSLQNETLILDDLFYLYYCKHGTTLIFVWILFGSEGSIEKDRKGHKYLFLQAKLIWNKFLSGTKLTFELCKSRSKGFQVIVPQGQIVRFLRGGGIGANPFFFFFSFFLGADGAEWGRGGKVIGNGWGCLCRTFQESKSGTWYLLRCLKL